MGREPILFVGVGKKRSGKSFQTMKMIRQYASGNPAKGVPPRRVLIMDVNDECVDVKAIRLSDVSLFSIHPIIEIRRIRPFHDNGSKMTLDDFADALFQVLQTFTGGLLLIEDVNKYISDTMPNDLIGAICTNRHIGVDIILHYQSIGRITSKVWQNVNSIRLHKFTDTVKKHKHKYEDKFEYLSIAEGIVNKKHEDGEKYFFLYVDIDDENIYGDFTEQDFEYAVNEFIQNNYTQLINPLLNARDTNGKKVHNHQTAMAEVRKKIDEVHEVKSIYFIYSYCICNTLQIKSLTIYRSMIFFLLYIKSKFGICF